MEQYLGMCLALMDGVLHTTRIHLGEQNASTAVSHITRLTNSTDGSTLPSELELGQGVALVPCMCVSVRVSLSQPDSLRISALANENA